MTSLSAGAMWNWSGVSPAGRSACLSAASAIAPWAVIAARARFSDSFSSPSPDGLYAIESFSNANTAPRYTLTRLADSHPVRTLADSPGLDAKLAALGTPIEFTDTPISHGVSLSTLIIRPPNFDPSKKYPVFTYIYGEPAGQTVVDRFDPRYIYLRSIAREGYVVLSFDNQGTPAPRGRDWRHAGYGAIGELSTQQQAEAIRAFAKAEGYRIRGTFEEHESGKGADALERRRQQSFQEREALRAAEGQLVHVKAAVDLDLERMGAVARPAPGGGEAHAALAHPLRGGQALLDQDLGEVRVAAEFGDARHVVEELLFGVGAEVGVLDLLVGQVSN